MEGIEGRGRGEGVQEGWIVSIMCHRQHPNHHISPDRPSIVATHHLCHYKASSHTSTSYCRHRCVAIAPPFKFVKLAATDKSASTHSHGKVAFTRILPSSFSCPPRVPFFFLILYSPLLFKYNQSSRINQKCSVIPCLCSGPPPSPLHPRYPPTGPFHYCKGKGPYYCCIHFHKHLVVAVVTIKKSKSDSVMIEMR